MKQNVWGIMSLVLGISGLCLACVVIGALPAVLGAVFAVIALLREEPKRGLAIAGFICSCVAIVLSILMIFVAADSLEDNKARGTARQSSEEADEEFVSEQTGEGETDKEAVSEQTGEMEPVTETWVENGNTYKGIKKDGLIDGEGVCLYESGNRYEGMFIAGKKEGIGTYYWVSGDYYEGEFKEDKMEGHGTYYWASGDYYEGEFKADKRDGLGTYYYANGDREEREYSAGELVGEPIYYKASGNDAPAAADYDNVELGDNMLQATVDGKKMTFYLDKENTASDGYELSYISFTPEGKANYRIYLRMPLRATAGTYSSSSGKACYFSVSTRYNEETGEWGDSFVMVHYGSSSSTDIGTYSLTLDSNLGFEYSEGSGSFEAEMEGSQYYSSMAGKTMSITDGRFHFTKDTTHEIVQAWRNGSMNQDAGTWVDPYQGTDKQEKKLCTKCGGTGKVICSVCDGSGTLVRRKESIDLGSGSTGYTETVKCACDNGYYKCSRCGGSGYTY